MEKTFKDIREVTMVSEDDSVIYFYNNALGRVKISTLFDKLKPLLDAEWCKISNPKNDDYTGTTIVNNVATCGDFSIPIYAYNDKKYEEYIAYTSTKSLSIASDTEIIALKVYGMSNSEKATTVTIDGKTWTLPPLGSEPAKFAHLFNTPATESVNLVFSAASRLIIHIYYKENS